MPRHLIINADDLGLHAARNRGIFEAARAGAVTSVSVLPNMEGFEDAVEGLRALPCVDVGLHFNVSEGWPVGPASTTLVDGKGRFWGKEETRRRALAGLLNPFEVVLELEAQVRKLRAAGLRVERIDGHQHIHVYGNVAKGVALGARRVGVAWTRLPIETVKEAPGPRIHLIHQYGRLARECAELYRDAGLRTADSFRGISLSGHMTPEALVALVRALPEGTTELMVHPGYARAAEGFDGPDREAELRALLSPSFREALRKERVELVGCRRSA